MNELFNGEYIKRAAELYVGATIEEPNAILIVNEALEKIGDFALNHVEHSVTAENSDWYDLPNDTTAILFVTDALGILYNQWSSRGTKICFEEAGTYKVHIRKMVDRINSLEEEIKIHPLFHQPIIAYVRGFLKLMDEDTSTDGKEQIQLFENGVALAYQMLSNIRKRL